MRVLPRGDRAGIRHFHDVTRHRAKHFGAGCDRMAEHASRRVVLESRKHLFAIARFSPARIQDFRTGQFTVGVSGYSQPAEFQLRE
jgi:hypothetical protein